MLVRSFETQKREERGSPEGPALFFIAISALDSQGAGQLPLIMSRVIMPREVE
jgi:hypothetical protein